MATREEILEELGLSPVWRLRAPARPGENVASDEAPPPEPLDLAASIAALRWEEFAGDV